MPFNKIPGYNENDTKPINTKCSINRLQMVKLDSMLTQQYSCLIVTQVSSPDKRGFPTIPRRAMLQSL
jgi:hypothetical protein